VGTCYDCWGLWIDTPHLNKLREEYPVATPLYQATTQLDPKKTVPSELLCPFCSGEHLLQQTIRGVEVEWCPDCRGIFLDKGERERLVGSVRKTRVSPPPGPAPSLFRTGQTPTGLGGLAVGEILAGLAELLFTARD
jgi:Zn-finger nucleic acid-binding protein